jgi:hypothetical protein
MVHKHVATLISTNNIVWMNNDEECSSCHGQKAFTGGQAGASIKIYGKKYAQNSVQK